MRSGQAREGVTGVPTVPRRAAAARPWVPGRRIGWSALARRVRPGEIEALTVVALVGLALVARLPGLQTIPQFTDEINENRFALQIARGEHFPLTALDPYFGPLHAYLLAALFKLFGPQIALPRLLVMALGAATVAATYLLGRELAGRAAGALAAAFLATSPQHILINSHVAWQNSTLPLYSTLCLWACARAIGAVSPPGARATAAFARPLGLAGFCFGLTLLVHPGAIVLVPAIGLALLIAVRRRRAWSLLRAPTPYLALLAALAAYSPILVYNLTHNLIGLRRVLDDRDYVYETSPSWASYRANLIELALQLLRMIGAPTQLPERPSGYLTSPGIILAAALCLAGLVVLARRGHWLPALVLLGTVAIMPRYLKAYVVPGVYHMALARYVAFLLPVLAVAAAVATLAAVGAVARATTRLRVPGRRPAAPRLRPVTLALSAALIAALLTAPLLALRAFYAEAARLDPANRTFATLLAELRAQRGDDAATPVLIDRYLDRIAFDQGINAGDAIAYLLDLQGIPYRAVDDLPGAVRALAAANPAARPLVIAMRDRCWRVRDEVSLLRVGDRLRLRELYRDVPSYFAVYRYAPERPGGCVGPDGAQPGD